MKKAATLIELIYVIVILSLLLVGGFRIINKLYVRDYIATQTSKMEYKTQQVLDQLALMLYYRVPLATIGYNQQTGDYKYIGYIQDGEDYPILEWIGFENDAMRDMNLSSFVDMNASDKTSYTLRVLDFHSSFIQNVVDNKFNTSDSLENLSAVIFSGTFDRGEEASLIDYNNSYGWHGGSHNYVYTISSIVQDGDDANITLNEKPDRIYEKFFLVDSAYAIARVEDLNASKWNCKELDINSLDKNDLLLFYNYRPWKSETFCGDGGEGNVTILSSNVSSFFVKKVNFHLEIKMEMLKQKGDISIMVSKQKVAF